MFHTDSECGYIPNLQKYYKHSVSREIDRDRNGKHNVIVTLQVYFHVAMNSKNFGLRIAGSIFGIVAVLHLLRIVSGIQVLVGDFSVPVWLNWMGLFGGGILCIWFWRLSGGSGNIS